MNITSSLNVEHMTFNATKLFETAENEDLPLLNRATATSPFGSLGSCTSKDQQRWADVLKDMDRDETGAASLEIRIQTESDKYQEGASETTFSELPPPPYPGGPQQEEGLASRRSSASASSQQGEPGERTSLSGSHHESTQVRYQGQTEYTPGESATDGGGDRMGSEGTGFGLCCILVLVSIGALLIVILVPLGFSDLEYYEMGFVKKKSTGSVDRSKVYMGGRHFIGVDATFKKFKADAHLESFKKMEFFNKEKLQVTMTFSLQYFLIPEELKSLHDAYDLGYRPVIRNTARSAVKDAATKFSVDDYRRQRPKVAAALFAAVRSSLGGTCCFKNCVKYTCAPTCKTTNCTKGLFSYVKYFQLEEVDITDEQEKKFLQTVMENEKRDTEVYKQKEKIERKKTEQAKIKIGNKAFEVSQNAAAKATFIKAEADASAKAIVEEARNSGLQTIYNAVNITMQEHKKSLDYVRTLRNHKNANLYIGFTTMIAKEGA